MDFTREPVVETVITPREGCKLVVRSSKGASQEEYFVDAVEVVSFGGAFFYRSTEKPKSFLLPVVDYEILEVREARIVLKQQPSTSAPSERSIKIGKKISIKEEKKEPKKEEAPKPEKKRERKKHFRKRRGGVEGEESSSVAPEASPRAASDEDDENKPSASSIIRSLLSPPPLISETIGHYRETYSQAFFDRDEEEEQEFKETPVASVEEETREETSTKDLWNFTD